MDAVCRLMPEACSHCISEMQVQADFSDCVQDECVRAVVRCSTTCRLLLSMHVSWWLVGPFSMLLQPITVPTTKLVH